MSLPAKLGRLLSRTFGRSPRVAIVASQIVPFDGVSNAVRDTIRAVTGAGWPLSVFTANNQFGSFPSEIVNSAADLLRSRPFKSADILLYHFAFYHDLFEVIRTGNGKAVQVVLFHNVTPEQYISDNLKPLVRASFAQIQHFHRADRLWPFTETNAKVLIEAGLDSARIRIVDPVVPWPRRRLHSEKESLPVDILFVGRITKSKACSICWMRSNRSGRIAA